MARLQILELPEGAGDDRAPFVLVIDQAPRDENSAAFRDDLDNNRIAAGIGARHVLVFEDTIDIPANDVPVGPDGYPLKIRIEGDFEKLREQVQEELQHAQGNLTRPLSGQQLTHERTEIARDVDRLAKWRNELTDALGMDRTRDWDDIRNTAAALRKERDAQAAKIERIIQLPETPQQGTGFETDDYLKGYRAAIRWALAALIGPAEDVLAPDA